MPLRDLLNLVNKVTVTKTISINDGMGGFTTTSSTTTIPLAAIWQNGSTNKWIADKYAKDSSHTLVFEYGAYTFDTTSTSGTVIETITYNGETYDRVGFPNNYLELNEIVSQQLNRTS